jgi:hypothetical protein
VAQPVESTLQLVGSAIPVFRVGPPQRPAIKHDDGFLGKFAPRKATDEDRAQLRAWIARLEVGEAIQGIPFLPKNNLPDALAAYRHFLFGDGKDRTFSYDRYVDQDASGRTTLANAIFQAQAGAEELAMLRRSKPYGWAFQMTSSVIPCGTDSEESPWGELYPYPATENWQKAIGAHYLWLSAGVTAAGNGIHLQMTMNLTLHAEDRYNFNPNNEDIATGIPDAANGRFELTGLGHQYTNYSTLTRLVRWTSMSFDPKVPALVTGSSGRHRQPADNRRLRNRL